MVDIMRDKLKELNLTSEEVNRFSEALKKEEFRKLLVEYANEISDPANRKLYEEEIEKLENERGVDVKFINPQPGFVMKTTQNGTDKIFINICKNENIQKPSSDVKVQNGKKGLFWSIPHSCSPVREDLDNSGKKCFVYDVVFHPDSYRMSETNAKFKKLLQDSAIETIENNFNVKIDSNNVKILKMSFKGNPVATVIRKARDNVQVKSSEPQEDLIPQLKTPYKYPPEEPKLVKNTQNNNLIVTDDENMFTTPKYTIINRGHADIQNFVNDLKLTVNSTRPKEIIIEIDLPLCKSANDLKLDIFEKRLYLESNKPNYKLDLNLPYPVNENDGGAKFDKTKKKLSVTLPVKEFKPENISTDVLVRPLTPPVTPPPTEEIELKSIEPTKVEKKPLIVPIKYTLPSKFELKQNKNLFKIFLNVNNIDKDTIKLDKLTKSYLKCKYETSGSGCYINYHSICVKFDLDYIDLSQDFKLEARNDVVVLEFAKLNENFIEKARVSIDEVSSDVTEHLISSFEEEEARKVLEFIKNDENLSSEEIKTDVKIVSNDKVVVTFTDQNDELDEDDDQEESSSRMTRQPTPPPSRVRSESHHETSSDDLSSSSGSRKLKSILKKPRSVSESESHGTLSGSDNALANRLSSSVSDSSGDSVNKNHDEREQLKKSVSFNKTIVKNVFKPGSAIAATSHKTKSEKNRKRNLRRKRTISDPSHSGDRNNTNERYRSLSESSDESGSSGSLQVRKDSNESLTDDGSIETLDQCEIMNTVNNHKPKTILNWNEEAEEAGETSIEKTKCAFKFSNSIMNELDD